MDSKLVLSLDNFFNVTNAERIVLYLKDFESSQVTLFVSKSKLKLYICHSSDECAPFLNSTAGVVFITDDWESVRKTSPSNFRFHIDVMNVLHESGSFSWNGESLRSTIFTGKKVFFHGYPSHDTSSQQMELQRIREYNCVVVENPTDADIVYVSAFRWEIAHLSNCDENMPNPKQLITAYMDKDEKVILDGGAWQDFLQKRSLVTISFDSLKEKVPSPPMAGLAFYLPEYWAEKSWISDRLRQMGGEVCYDDHKFCHIVVPRGSLMDAEAFFGACVARNLKTQERSCVTADYIRHACANRKLHKQDTAVCIPPRLKPFFMCGYNEQAGRRVFVQEEHDSTGQIYQRVSKMLAGTNALVLQGKRERDDTVFCERLSSEPVQQHFHTFDTLVEWCRDPLTFTHKQYHIPLYVHKGLSSTLKDYTFIVFATDANFPEAMIERDALTQMGGRNIFNNSECITQRIDVTKSLIIWDSVDLKIADFMKEFLGTEKIPPVYMLGFARILAREQNPDNKSEDKMSLEAVKRACLIRNFPKKLTSAQAGKPSPAPRHLLEDHSTDVHISDRFEETLGAGSAGSSDSDEDVSTSTRDFDIPAVPLFGGLNFAGTDSFRTVCSAERKRCQRTKVLKRPGTQTKSKARRKSQSCSAVRVCTVASKSNEQTHREILQNEQLPVEQCQGTLLNAVTEENMRDGESPRKRLPGVKSRHAEFTSFGCTTTLRSLLVQFADSLEAVMVTCWTFHGCTAHNDSLPFSVYTIPSEGGVCPKLFCLQHGTTDNVALQAFSSRLCASFRDVLLKLGMNPKMVRTENQFHYIIRDGERNAVCATCAISECFLHFSVYATLRDTFNRLPTVRTFLMPFGVGIMCDLRNSTDVDLACTCKTVRILGENARLQTYDTKTDLAFMECALVIKCGGVGSTSLELYYCFGATGIEMEKFSNLKTFDFTVHATIRDRQIQNTDPLELFVCSDCASSKFHLHAKTELGLVKRCFDSIDCLCRTCPKKSSTFYMLHQQPDQC